MNVKRIVTRDLDIQFYVYYISTSIQINFDYTLSEVRSHGRSRDEEIFFPIGYRNMEILLKLHSFEI